MVAIFLVINGILLIVVQQPNPMYVPESGGAVAQMQKDGMRFLAHDFLAGGMFRGAKWLVMTWEGGQQQGYRVTGAYFCEKLDKYYSNCPWGVTPLGERLSQFEGSVVLMTCAEGGYLLVVAAPARLEMGEELVHVACNRLCEMID